MRRLDPVLLAFLGLSLAGNVYLYRHQHPHAAPVQALQRGQKLQALEGATLDGQQVKLTYERRPVVLYTFSASCLWCERNLDNARRLADQVSQRYDFVAVALDDRGLADYVKKRQLSWRIVRNVPDKIRRAYGMGSTPQTIVVDVGGVVRYAWTGAFVAELQKEVESAFGVRLPGISEIPAQPSAGPVTQAREIARVAG